MRLLLLLLPHNTVTTLARAACSLLLPAGQKQQLYRQCFAQPPIAGSLQPSLLLLLLPAESAALHTPVWLYAAGAVTAIPLRVTWTQPSAAPLHALLMRWTLLQPLLRPPAMVCLRGRGCAPACLDAIADGEEGARLEGGTAHQEAVNVGLHS